MSPIYDLETIGKGQSALVVTEHVNLDYFIAITLGFIWLGTGEFLYANAVTSVFVDCIPILTIFVRL